MIAVVVAICVVALFAHVQLHVKVLDVLSILKLYVVIL